MIDVGLFDVILIPLAMLVCVSMGVMFGCMVCVVENVEDDDYEYDENVDDENVESNREDEKSVYFTGNEVATESNEVAESNEAAESNVGKKKKKGERRNGLKSRVRRASIRPILQSIARNVCEGRRAFVLLGTKGEYAVSESSKAIAMSKLNRQLCVVDVVDVTEWSNEERRVLLRGIKEPYVLFKDAMYCNKVFELHVSGNSSIALCRDRLPAAAINTTHDGYTVRLSGPTADELAWLTLIRKLSNTENPIEEVEYE